MLAFVPHMAYSSCDRKNLDQKLRLNDLHGVGLAGASRDLSAFRRELHHCMTPRLNAVFELVDAVLCVAGPVRSLPELSMVAAGKWRSGNSGIWVVADAGL
ncbi:hypothetical protein ACIBCN_44115 [Nocardia sp. NPDC051052]|uniref:hypothetical protein n=1 Tax=Nocardia sp. NPDC051052 TaxID=3364322 RepID=UPI00379F7ECB